MKKYELIENCRKAELYQIQAVRDFTTSAGNAVKKGDLGGFVSGEHNLCHEGNCWVANNAKVKDQACVYENAYISDNVEICGDVQIYGNAKIWGNTLIQGGFIRIKDNVQICAKEITGINKFSRNTRIIGENIVINEHINLGSDAFIQSQDDFFQIKMFSDFMEYFTAYKTENGFKINYNEQSFSPEQIHKALKAYAEYETAIKLAKSRILGGFNEISSNRK